MSAQTDTADLRIEAADPRAPEAAALIERLTEELARRYDDDGVGGFQVEHVLQPRSVFLLGWLGERAVACGALRPLEGDIAEVKRMFVAPDVRGRGIGRRILAELEARARQWGYTAVWLETGVLQPEAIRVYETAGYRRIENYGYYRDDPRSVCFEKVFAAGEQP
jgi:GNAT superfamily N-acetyltransferase